METSSHPDTLLICLLCRAIYTDAFFLGHGRRIGDYTAIHSLCDLWILILPSRQYIIDVGLPRNTQSYSPDQALSDRHLLGTDGHPSYTQAL